MNGSTDPTAFWREFVATHWERSPVVVRSPIGPIATPGEVLAIAARAFRDKRDGCRFYVDGDLVIDRATDYHPREDDGTLQGYTARLRASRDIADYAAVVNDYAQFSVRQFERLRALLDPLHDLVGTPAIAAPPTLFFGNYRLTPFGVHRDPESVFTWVIEGRKRYLLWPADRIAPGDRFEADLAALRDEAIVLEAGPGDLVYWPWTFWHIAESDGSFAATASIGIYRDVIRPERDPGVAMVQGLLDLTAELLAARSPRLFRHEPFAPAPRTARHATALPELLASALGELRAVVTGPELEERVTRRYLERLTGAALLTAPPPDPADPALERALADAATHVRGVAPVVFVPAGEPGYAICAANGHSVRVRAFAGLPALLERLERAEPCALGALLDAHASAPEGGASRDEIRALLSELARLRAVQVEGHAT